MRCAAYVSGAVTLAINKRSKINDIARPTADQISTRPTGDDTRSICGICTHKRTGHSLSTATHAGRLGRTRRTRRSGERALAPAWAAAAVEVYPCRSHRHLDHHGG